MKKGDTFALILRNAPEFIILSMALGKIGAVAVPINFLEKADRLALILNDAKAVGVLTSREFYRNVATASKNIPTLKLFYFREGEHKDFSTDFPDPAGGRPAHRARRGERRRSHDAALHVGHHGPGQGRDADAQISSRTPTSARARIHLNQKDRFLCLLPLFHSFSWTTCAILPLKLGCRIVIIESLLPFDPVIAAIWKYKITLFVAVPQIYSALTTKIKGAKAVILRLLNPIRLCISGAAPLAPKVHESFEKTFGLKLIEGYGLTECAPVATLNPEKKNKHGTVGIALPGVEIGIRDDDGRPLKQGEVGEIWIRGDNVMKGYYHKAGETAEALTADHWLRTGDMGRFDEEGYLSIVDRKDLIIIKGLNVYPQEVELVLMKDDRVKEVAVVGKMDPDTGEETIRAFVTAARGGDGLVDKAALLALCREGLSPL